MVSLDDVCSVWEMFSRPSNNQMIHSNICEVFLVMNYDLVSMYICISFQEGPCGRPVFFKNTEITFSFCGVVYGRGGLSGLHRECRTFGGLVMQVYPCVYSVRTMFEGWFTVEGTGAVKSIFELGFKFVTYVSRKKFDSTASEDQGAIGEQSESDFLSDHIEIIRDITEDLW